MPTSAGHILENILISQSITEGDGVIAIVRPDFSVCVKSEAIKPNSSPARVELDTRSGEIRVWMDDRNGSSRPNRTVKKALTESATRRKVACSRCGEIDIDEFTGTDRTSWGRSGWKIENGSAICPVCAEVVAV